MLNEVSLFHLVFESNWPREFLLYCVNNININVYNNSKNKLKNLNSNLNFKKLIFKINLKYFLQNCYFDMFNKVSLGDLIF